MVPGFAGGMPDHRTQGRPGVPRPLGWPWPPGLVCRACHDVQGPAVEARSRSGVARSADLVDPHQEGVAVAVKGHGLHPLHVAGGIPLAPVLLARAGVKVTRPVVMVRLRASSSIQPSMSTSWVSNCCTMAATRPALSRLRADAMSAGRGPPESWAPAAVPASARRGEPEVGLGAGCSDIRSSLVPIAGPRHKRPAGSPQGRFFGWMSL